ncbi:MAG: metal-dependent transcriptional regulator [Actinobacteria bacterium]|nr:metal-dependent transcriptional regulator [Actinomycetota bacterium]
MGTNAFERYLDVIYEIEAAGGEVRVKDIASALEVSYPSVSEMVDRLVTEGLVTHDKYQNISLTSRGRRIGKGLDEKHEVIKRFFANVLGVDEKVADKDACEIEHVISNESLDRLVRYLESIPEAGRRSSRR